MAVEYALVRVIFSGLIAFVPQGEPQNKQISALLVDAQSPPAASDGCPIHPHRPFLYYKNFGDCGKGPGEEACVAKGSLCLCPLDRVDIDVSDVDRDGCGDQGNETCDVGALDNLVNMRRAKPKGARTLKGCTEPIKCDRRESYDESGLKNLVGRVLGLHVNGPIAAIRQSEEDRGRDFDKYKFESLVYRTWSSATYSPKSLVEILQIPTISSIQRIHEKRFVTLKWQSFNCEGGSGEFLVPVEPCQDYPGWCADVYVSNDMVEDEMEESEDYGGFCHDLDKGRHFELFYELSRSRIYSNEMPVPQLRRKQNQGEAQSANKGKGKAKNGSGYDEAFLKNVLHDIGLRAGENRPICPMPVMSQ